MNQFELGQLHQGLSYEDYASQQGLRSSHLYHLRRSPAHLVAAIQNPAGDTDAFRMGRLVHEMIQNGDKFLDAYVVAPTFSGLTKDGKESTRSKEALLAKAEWYASIPKDRIVVTAEEVITLNGIALSIKSSKKLQAMLKDSTREASGWVQDPVTGLTLQFRPDFITSMGHLADVKTCIDAQEFKSEIFSNRKGKRFYILQAAHYAYCAKLMGLGRSESFLFIAIEKTAPYGLIPYFVDLGGLAVGEQWRMMLTQRYAECLSKSNWPNYPDEIIPADVPQWAPVPGMEEI